MEPIHFIHLTDTHINAPHREGLYQRNMADNLRTVLAHVQASGVRPALFVISGDLAHEGDAEDYRFLRELLEAECGAFGVPFFVSLGNHDHRAPFREGFLGEAPSDEPYYFSVIIDGLRLIVLNSQVENSPIGTVDENQLAWLDDVLKTPAPVGSVVVLHHPMLPPLGSVMDDFHLTNRDEVAGVINGRDVIGILAGHIHANRVASFHGMISAAGSGTAFGLEMADDRTVRFFENRSYNVVTVHRGSMNVQTLTLPGMQRELSRKPLENLLG
ncbi:metallophosphoesterase [Paenibacillus sp. PDC88]|uniref:metallophosphoesterase family protein n=1 Tax=Paenibacillus TaxID=44249 RepID=UPI0008990CB8|nr:metallophosphoesterase [Paenibacillus sp. PDC88]SDX83080.1 Calcineurin-like phosphoesterase [Paenibacillus sp. PDC88]